MTIDEINYELNARVHWFNTYYTVHEQKYRRLISMGINVEENSKLLEELYVQAEKVRFEIQELEKLL